MGRTVLIVDDSKLARMSVAKALGALHPDWKRVEASNADEAMAAVAAGGIDIVLLDFNMPGRDGLEVAGELRAQHPDMPVALISANTQIEILDRAAAVGAVFLAKPLSEAALAGFLKAATS
jgi:CheY-like chemotaxis protein